MKQIMRLAGYVLGLLLLVYVAILYNSVALLFTAVILFLLPPLELFMLFLQYHGITISSSCIADSVTKGDNCYLWLTVTNNSHFPLLLLSLTVSEQDGSKTQEVSVTLNPRESRKYEVSFPMERCGIRRLYLQEGWLQDYMGWFRLPLRQSFEESTIVVYPKEQVQELTKEQAILNQDAEEGPESVKRGQKNDQPLGVRPYIAGDSLKYIHWNMSAKRGELFVREYSEDSNAMYLMLIEVFSLNRLSIEEQENTYQALSTLSCSLLAAGCSHYAAIIYSEAGSGSPLIKRYCVTEQQELKAYLYALYQLVEQPEEKQRNRTHKSKTIKLTKEQRLDLYNQYYYPFPRECVSYIPE